jgi:polysaccharide biosynthesis protein PslG
MTNNDNPYGVTIFNSSSTRLPLAQTIPDMQALGLAWLRYQIPWSSIESPQGTYIWTSLDAIVAACNTAGINITFPLQFPPTWGQDGTTGLPTPSAMATFATQVATRYNGTGAYGHLDAIEVGNEEFDSSTYNNTTYPPVVQAVVPAIKAAGFTGKIGCAAILGEGSVSHILNWIQVLYDGYVAQLLDYYTIHYYTGAENPAQSHSFLTADQAFLAIQQALIANNDAGKIVWMTEFGYAVNTSGGHSSSNIISSSLQEQYYQYICTAAVNSSVIKKIFFYTMDSGSANSDGESITQGIAPNETFLPAFWWLKSYIAAHPTLPIPLALQAPVDSVTVGIGGVTSATLSPRIGGQIGITTQFNLVDGQKQPVNLSNTSALSCSMRIQNTSNSGTNTGAGTFFMIDAAHGIVGYHWALTDLGVAATYAIQVRIEFPLGRVVFDTAKITVTNSL